MNQFFGVTKQLPIWSKIRINLESSSYLMCQMFAVSMFGLLLLLLGAGQEFFFAENHPDESSVTKKNPFKFKQAVLKTKNND